MRHLSQFTSSFACTSRVHCRTCRDPGPEGVRFRLSEAGAEQFDCPHPPPQRPAAAIPEGWDPADYQLDSHGTAPCGC